jgi:hypothetical protein
MMDVLKLLLPHRKYNETAKNENAHIDEVMQTLNETIHESDLDAKIAYYESQIMLGEDHRID